MFSDQKNTSYLYSTMFEIRIKSFLYQIKHVLKKIKKNFDLKIVH